jgi:hypothetical protein
MFNIGDVVQHHETGQNGQVIGYGHQIVNGVYLSTLRVHILQTESDRWQIKEDIYLAWTSVTTAPVDLRFAQRAIQTEVQSSCSSIP